MQGNRGKEREKEMEKERGKDTRCDVEEEWVETTQVKRWEIGGRGFVNKDHTSCVREGVVRRGELMAVGRKTD